MSPLYPILFVILVLFSAFFSSAETSLLSLNKIKLSHRAKKAGKKARLLEKILNQPEEFFSTILIGNNLANIAAASIATILVGKVFVKNENAILLISTAITTLVILLFAEIIPKSYAFRFNEKLSYLYAYPIKFFNIIFLPLVKGTTLFSRLFLQKRFEGEEKKDLTLDEIKHFLSTEIKLFRYHPESLRLLNEVIDVFQKDIKTIMIPIPNIIALEEDAPIESLRQIILEKKVSAVPVYRKNLNHITGIIHTKSLLPLFLENRSFSSLRLKELAQQPIFVSEYSSLIYIHNRLKRTPSKLVVVLDEYGATIGIITQNDLFLEIFGEIEIRESPIKEIAPNVFSIKGGIPVDEVNSRLSLELPEKKDYTTLSGFFIYHFGKLPRNQSQITYDRLSLMVEKMGRRKIERIKLIVDSDPGKKKADFGIRKKRKELSEL